MWCVVEDLRSRAKRIERIEEEKRRLEAEYSRAVKEHDEAAIRAATLLVEAGEGETMLIGPEETLWRIESHGRLVQFGRRAKSCMSIHIPVDDAITILSVRGADLLDRPEAEACA